MFELGQLGPQLFPGSVDGRSFGAPPRRQNFIQNLLCLDGEGLGLTKFERNNDLAVAHAGLEFHGHQPEELQGQPFAALDERSRFQLQDLLLELKARLSLQFVFVTHSIAEAVYLADRILLLDTHGSARDWRAIDFAERNQRLKLTPAFNALVESYTQLFHDVEHRTFASAGAR